MDKNNIEKKAIESLDKINTNIETLEKKSLEIRDDMREALEEKISILKDQKTEIVTKYENLKSATSESLNELSDAFTESVEAFQSGFDSIIKKF